MTHADLIRRVTQTLIDHVDELTALDQAIGDGDHGLNMRRGALAIQARLGELAGQSLNEALRTMGTDLHVDDRRLLRSGVRHAPGDPRPGTARPADRNRPRAARSTSPSRR